jgi:hypothetical protein
MQMSIDTKDLRSGYPKLFERLPEEDFPLRELMVIDENINDGDVDELDEIDSSEYNYIVYIAERLQNALGGVDSLVELAKSLDEDSRLGEYMPVEEDLYGIQFDGSEDELVRLIFGHIERLIP